MTSAKHADTAKRKLLKFRMTATAQNITPGNPAVCYVFRTVGRLGGTQLRCKNDGSASPADCPWAARRPATIVFAGGNLAAAPRQQAALDENIMPLDYFAIASKPAAVLPLEA